MSMLFQVFFKWLVALQARQIAFHPLGQLVRGRALMHRMTGKARHVALLKTRGFEQPIVFTPGDPNHAVTPKRAPALLE